MLDRIFNISARGGSVRNEVLGGVATWLTMVYITAVNPQILSTTGMDFGAVFVATILAAAVGTALIGLLANVPFAMAPGMGLNAVFVYSIVIGAGLSWESALGIVFWSGILFVAISLSPIRERIINDMPECLKTGAAVGIGLFLAVIGLSNANLVVKGEGVLLSLGDTHSLPALLAFLGLFLMLALHAKGRPWAVIAGIGIVTVLGWVLDPNAAAPTQWVSAPPSMEPTLLKLNVWLRFDTVVISLILSLLFVDLFDTSGALIAVGKQGGFLDSQGRFPNIRRALAADSLATVAGALFGASTTTTYIESAAGVSAGARTGLASMVVSLLFLATLFVAPLAASIPTYATAPALIMVSILLVTTLRNFRQWDDLTESAPMILGAVFMPLSFSIADGLGVGFIAYAVIKLFSGRARELNLVTIAITIAFLLRFAFLTH